MQEEKYEISICQLKALSKTNSIWHWMFYLIQFENINWISLSKKCIRYIYIYSDRQIIIKYQVA